MIQINTKSDSRIAQDFPNDPYSNLAILTETQTLNLQLAFLTMDSGYFSKIDPDAQEIDLRHLKEDPLIRVLHSLYGQQLVAQSVSDLVELYPIISALEIEDYRTRIEEEVRSNQQILESLQFLQLSFRQKICWEQVVKVHISNKLRALEESKNYLQLSKIEKDSFEHLLLLFMQKYGSAEDKVVNNIMDNYFNRKGIKAIPYLQQPHLQPLQAVWLKYHHVPVAHITQANQVTPKSSPTIVSSSVIPPVPAKSQHNLPDSTIHAQSHKILEEKRRRVAEMEKQINQKDLVIQQLSQKIEEVKKELGFKGDLAKPTTARSLVVQGSEGKTRGRKQSKKLIDLLGEDHEDNESISDHKRKSKNKDKKEFHRLGSKNRKG